ncbi:GDSL esterase/lipase [Hibiscus syriacus]|uniref:GDSL esterase/lipase n=1 Tax=Hibiscus syriacus TaxID=106335 RepID=A0A6A3C8Y0_HIBSY|nr:GDSL esterase/lipase [Hibiscus syriacus]
MHQILAIHLWPSTICFAHNVSAFFVFGDSLVEVGNNYYIDTLAKPQFPNGEELGFKDYAPPFLSPNTSGDLILKGVNYASSGAGILQSTGSFMRLYNLDARKIAVSNAPKVGCTPFEIDLHLCANDCVALLNALTKLYNTRLKSMLEDLTRRLTGSTFVYVDYYALTEDLVDNYRSYGFENADYACCEVIGRHGGLIPCISLSRVCPDRTKYVFWDPFHPTESAVLIGAKYLLDGGPKYISPINIRQLVNS